MKDLFDRARDLFSFDRLKPNVEGAGNGARIGLPIYKFDGDYNEIDTATVYTIDTLFGVEDVDLQQFVSDLRDLVRALVKFGTTLVLGVALIRTIGGA
ncbi:MAG: hypothetical protein AAF532_09635 [Planctomycetota bacterium]